MRARAPEYLVGRVDVSPGGWRVLGQECLPTRGVRVHVRNSCKRSSDWFPRFDRHLIPRGRRAGQGEGPAVGDERFRVGGVLQTVVYGWALTLPPFFLSVPLP